MRSDRWNLTYAIHVRDVPVCRMWCFSFIIYCIIKAYMELSFVSTADFCFYIKNNYDV